VAGDGPEALERLRAERFDAVLLDLNLGTRIDGKDVLLELERKWPEMLSSTFLSTGDPTSATVRELTRRLTVRVLAKPFGVEELREMLRALTRET
jgi:DNA-binding response OmpR family regulator